MEHFIRKILTFDDEIDLAKYLLREVINLSGSTEGSVYFLSLSSKNFEEIAFISQSPNHRVGRKRDCNIELPSALLISREPSYVDNVLICPIFRRDTCIAYVELLAPTPTLTDAVVNKIHTYCHFLIVSYSKRFNNNLLSKLQEPINFQHTTKEEFLLDIMQAISRASGIDMVAIRELDADGNLTCIGINGFPGYRLDDFSFRQNEIPEEFKLAIETGCEYQITDAKNIIWLQHNGAFKGIESFIIIPIMVGENIFGTISFASKRKYDFCKTEILGLTNIANGIGISINNYRNFIKANTEVAHLSEMAVCLTGLEIAQAVRHEAKSLVHRCHETIAALKRRSKQTILSNEDQLDAISDTLESIYKSLDKIRLATRPPQKEKKTIKIKEVWDQAVFNVSGRLSDLNVSVKFDGPNPIIDVYPDWLRQAFLNLLLNSIDAYKRRASKKVRNKAIVLHITKESEKSDFIELFYSDNAGGIEVSNLAIPIEVKEKMHDLNQILFEPNVSSKGDNGSGWGLYIVRQSIQYHKGGSVDLISHKPGVRFRIKLPKTLSTDNP